MLLLQHGDPPQILTGRLEDFEFGFIGVGGIFKITRVNLVVERG